MNIKLSFRRRIEMRGRNWWYGWLELVGSVRNVEDWCRRAAGGSNGRATARDRRCWWALVVADAGPRPGFRWTAVAMAFHRLNFKAWKLVVQVCKFSKNKKWKRQNGVQHIYISKKILSLISTKSFNPITNIYLKSLLFPYWLLCHSHIKD